MNTDLKPQSATTEFLNFSDALHHLRWGERVARRVWSSGHYVEVLYTNVESPRLLIKNRLAQTTMMHIGGHDLMAEDWYVLGQQE
jgi:hypothetical protein